MIITESFVLLNYPKSGSTFARTVLAEIHEKRSAAASRWQMMLLPARLRTNAKFIELMVPNIKLQGGPEHPDQHGCYSQIPACYKHLEVATIVRNPFERFLSAFEFRWWVRFPAVPIPKLMDMFPNFPHLVLDEYVEFTKVNMQYGRMNGDAIRANVGNQTVQFIQMFFRKPREVLAKLTDDYIESDQIFDDMAPITCLRQERLNEDFAEFLGRHGYSADECNYVRQRARVNVTERRGERLTSKAVDHVWYSERMIFRILKSKGVEYEFPSPLS